MRAFAIKNKEGKYKTSCSEYINSLWQADIFDDYELALCYCLDSEKPVEVTIAEGDLEKENTMLKKALELACNITNLNYITRYKPEHFMQQAKEELKDEN